MGFFDKTLSNYGYERQQQQKSQPTQKDYTTSSGAYGSVIGANSWNPAFSSFNNERQQLLAYRDWVYIAAHTNAEQLAAIDLRVFEVHINNADTLGMAQKLIDNPKEAQKYIDKKVNYFETKNGLVEYRKSVPALEEVYTHPLLTLLNHPNPYMVKNEFLEITGLHLELTGNAYWFIHRDKKGTPIELWPLLPNGMSIVPDETHFVIGYMYTTNGRRIPLDPEDVVHHKYGNPMDFRYGYSPVMAGSTTIDADTHAAIFNQRFFYNTAMPDGFLTTDETLDEKSFKRLKTEWMDTYSGAVNAHRTAILSGGLQYKNLQISQRDMEFLQGRNFNRDQILALFGVPKSTLGFDESMSRANSETADYILAKRSRIKMQRLTNRITMNLAPQFGNKNLIVSFTDPVPEDKAQVLDDLATSLGGTNTVGFNTINEVRAKRGDMPVPGGDQIFIPEHMLPLGNLGFSPAPTGTPADAQEQEEAGKPKEDVNDPQNMEDEDGADDTSGMSAGTGVSDSGSVTSETNNSNRSIEHVKVEEKQTITQAITFNAIPDKPETFALPDFPDPIILSSKGDGPDFLDQAKEKAVAPSLLFTEHESIGDFLQQRFHQADFFEVRFLRSTKEHFTLQKEEVLYNVQSRDLQQRSFQGLTRKEVKQKIDDLFDKNKSAIAWSAALLPIYKGAGDAGGKLAADLLNKPKVYGYDAEPPETMADYNDVSALVDKYFMEHEGTISADIDLETDKQLRATLTEGINAGESLQQLMDRIEKVYSAALSYRTQRIARTEAESALQYANNAVWENSGMVESYIWVNGSIDPCKIICRIVGGTIASTPDGFAYGYPPHPNCKCAIIPYKLRALVDVAGTNQ